MVHVQTMKAHLATIHAHIHRYKTHRPTKIKKKKRTFTQVHVYEFLPGMIATRVAAYLSYFICGPSVTGRRGESSVRQGNV